MHENADGGDMLHIGKSDKTLIRLTEDQRRGGTRFLLEECQQGPLHFNKPHRSKKLHRPRRRPRPISSYHALRLFGMCRLDACSKKPPVAMHCTCCLYVRGLPPEQKLRVRHTTKNTVEKHTQRDKETTCCWKMCEVRVGVGTCR